MSLDSYQNLISDPETLAADQAGTEAAGIVADDPQSYGVPFLQAPNDFAERRAGEFEEDLLELEDGFGGSPPEGIEAFLAFQMEGFDRDARLVQPANDDYTLFVNPANAAIASFIKLLMVEQDLGTPEATLSRDTSDAIVGAVKEMGGIPDATSAGDGVQALQAKRFDLLAKVKVFEARALEVPIHAQEELLALKVQEAENLSRIKEIGPMIANWNAMAGALTIMGADIAVLEGSSETTSLAAPDVKPDEPKSAGPAQKPGPAQTPGAAQTRPQAPGALKSDATHVPSSKPELETGAAVEGIVERADKPGMLMADPVGLIVGPLIEQRMFTLAKQSSVISKHLESLKARKSATLMEALQSELKGAVDEYKTTEKELEDRIADRRKAYATIGHNADEKTHDPNHRAAKVMEHLECARETRALYQSGKQAGLPAQRSASQAQESMEAHRNVEEQQVYKSRDRVDGMNDEDARKISEMSKRVSFWLSAADDHQAELDKIDDRARRLLAPGGGEGDF
jgi:hypothetical protein